MVNAQGTVAISNTAVPQFDIVSISDIPAYGVIEKSGCGEFKGKVKIRIDCFLTPESPYYDQYGGAYVVDTASKEYLAGYKGAKDDKTGEPLDWDDYNKWLDSLPTVWQDNPFHSHFVYYDTTVLDDSIKAQIAKVTEYFYAFHTYCWDNSLEFIPQWQKVPKQVGTIRDVFIAGDSSPPNKSVCELKAIEITSRTGDFDTREFDKTPSTPTDLNIGEKGTIDVGSAAIDRGTTTTLKTATKYYTAINYNNASNADGIIDAVQVYCNTAEADNSIKFGTFVDNGGNNLTCHDAEEYGEVSVGLNSCTGLTLEILTGEYIGADARAVPQLWVDRDTTGGSGVYTAQGQFCDPTDTSDYSLDIGGNDVWSLYGTGTESGGDPDISNTPAIWEVGTVATSTDYWSSGAEPEWPLDDGECHFTVTNNGDTCSMTIKGTNFTGGVGWTLAGSPGENTVTMKAGKSGDANEGAFVTLTTGEQSFISGLAGSGTKKWELMMESATSHTDGVEKTGVVTLTATLD
jgi:hypothetical protein